MTGNTIPAKPLPAALINISLPHPEGESYSLSLPPFNAWEKDLLEPHKDNRELLCWYALNKPGASWDIQYDGSSTMPVNLAELKENADDAFYRDSIQRISNTIIQKLDL